MGTNTTGELGIFKPASGETGWADTVNTSFDTIDTNVSNLMYGIPKTEQSFANGDTTPDVSSGRNFNDVGWSGAATITTFDGGVAGQKIQFRATTSNVTFDSALIHTGLSMPCQAGDYLEWFYNGSAWVQTSGTVGMGANYIEITSNAIGDFPAVTATTPTDVDVSDDGVRSGAVKVYISWRLNNMNTATDLRVRAKGSSDNDGVESQVNRMPAAVGDDGSYIVALDENAVFEAWFSTSGVSVTNLDMHVRGYWI